jgi:pimeloyl-ACP methyl ester carboxylesterase
VEAAQRNLVDGRGVKRSRVRAESVVPSDDRQPARSYRHRRTGYEWKIGNGCASGPVGHGGLCDGRGGGRHRRSAGAADALWRSCGHHNGLLRRDQPGGGQSTLYGLRYIDRGARVDASTPAIVLVHGIASSTENWDFSPTWSVARGLAAAGYVVYSYDRLGYAKSSYFSQPGGGTTLTTAAHQAELHQIVEEVQSGALSTTTGSDCSAPQRPNRIRNRRVVIIGHSAGGWVVAGYPGQYHDVVAMIQADIPASSATLLGQSSGGGFTPDPDHPDYFEFFQTTQNCLDFNTYPPGVVQYVVDIACTPPFLDSPFGELTDLAVMYAQNDAYISMIGPSVPVLLTSGEEDTTDPPSSADADYAYYQQHCSCDVTQLLLPDTAHLFMVHQSLPIWLNYVVGWLSDRGLQPTRPLPPVRCTDCVVPFVR